MAQSSGTSAQSTETQSGSTTGGKGLSTSGSATPARLADDTSQGKTTIAASVVQKIAGIAAREISGVHAMGGGVSRAFGAIRERIPGGSGTTTTQGVTVEVGEKQAAIDLDIVVEYGASIVELARAVRRNVINGVERMTGLEVIEVNISVNDIHLPSEDDEDGGNGGSTPASSRVE
ncbi:MULTISPECIES: Asp23/Gls24 family envelope stress response protein [Saccharopolyspora]|uniref:Asp23/Gls24 family envelope stress response protein n=1 Tax=Saccharopolyspora gregorii TaxID=33914 RepID=A0ABP6RUV4_9PSEU|nr:MULTISPECIES: Asp23/Gls24 family envelope stress response protein [Saccharopolyspora]MCA1186137.1 Asp23/Gls24 family envelope stress response protein [Saccharopolyspora sp. 6T]MCA1193102.1 Asp23/Gls24 family envelope stress response protein [Saccharopolyspora sp. 6V]MCA1224593.1 Asp23/Gls24 family envelope stress response protein [Saccharopolyspora sp. 6M]MCA1279064.1 Asp23/Gls24 family envelope stress response protein [Saccharopolyspora sp. 7B]